MWYAQVSVYDNCACAVAETLKLGFRAISKFFLGYMLVRIETTFTESLYVTKQRTKKKRMKKPFHSSSVMTHLFSTKQ